MREVKKETGFFREQWVYFKKGKNEINFLMNVYQTLFLLLSLSFLGDLPVQTLLILTGGFVISFILIANRLGAYTAKKVDTSGFYVSPYFVDQTLFRRALIRGLIHLNLGEKDEAGKYFAESHKIIQRWIPEEGERL